jgi:hypothetical protein
MELMNRAATRQGMSNLRLVGRSAAFSEEHIPALVDREGQDGQREDGRDPAIRSAKAFHVCVHGAVGAGKTLLVRPVLRCPDAS